MVVESNFPPWGPQPMCALLSLIPVGCPTPPSWGKPLEGALINVDVDEETNSQLTDVLLIQLVTAGKVRNLFDENSISTKS